MEGETSQPNEKENDSDEEEMIENINESDVFYHRPTTFQEYRESVDAGALYGLDVVNELELSLEDFDINVDTKSISRDDVVRQSSKKYLNKLANIMKEFVTTESTYVSDVLKLESYLSDCCYSTLKSVRNFVASDAFIGFRITVDNICVANGQFLKLLSNLINQLPSMDIPVLVDDNFHSIMNIHNLLCDILSQFTPFFGQYKHFIILHRPISVLYSNSCENGEFQAYTSDCEKAMGQSLLSLSIKPVQRLPRYVLLCKEMHNCICQMRSVYGNEISSEHHAVLKNARMRCRGVYEAISNCTLLCNNAIRDNEDLQKLHNLHHSFKAGGSILAHSSIVVKGRMYVRVGELKRHHKHSGIKSHVCHVFSDVLIVSFSSGKGLKLEHMIPLFRGCGTVCLPVPNFPMTGGDNSTHSSGAGCWFLVISKCILFLCAKSAAERDQWVHAINYVLKQNHGDLDIVTSKKQVGLTNALISEINEQRKTKSDVAAQQLVEAHWYRLLDLLEEIVKKRDDKHDSGANEVNSSVSGLRTVIEEHNEVVMDSILETLEPKKVNILANVIALKSQHFPIISGWFFDKVYKTTSTFQNSDFLRPTVYHLYLLNDMLIGTQVHAHSHKQCSFTFHILLCNMECRAGSATDIHANGIVIVDKSIPESRGFISSLFSSSGQRREWQLVCPTVEQKLLWVALLGELVQYNTRLSEPVWQGPKGEDPASKLSQLPLASVMQMGDLLCHRWARKEVMDTAEQEVIA